MKNEEYNYNHVLMIVFGVLLYISIQGQVTGTSVLEDVIPSLGLRWTIYISLGVGFIFFLLRK